MYEDETEEKISYELEYSFAHMAMDIGHAGKIIDWEPAGLSYLIESAVVSHLIDTYDLDHNNMETN